MAVPSKCFNLLFCFFVPSPSAPPLNELFHGDRIYHEDSDKTLLGSFILLAFYTYVLFFFSFGGKVESFMFEVLLEHPMFLA